MRLLKGNSPVYLCQKPFTLVKLTRPTSYWSQKMGSSSLYKDTGSLRSRQIFSADF
jgi:hypothetical protein